MRIGSWPVAALVALMTFVSPAFAQSNPAVSLIEPEVTLEPDASRGRAFVILKADRLDKDWMAGTLQDVGDLNAPTPPSVTVKVEPQELDRTETSRRWLLTMEIDGLPRNVTQKRYLSFRLRDQQFTLPYTLSNKNTATFTWSVKGPPGELRPAPGQPVEIGVAVQGVAATQVRLLQVTLVEQSRRNPLRGGWTLCPTRERCTDRGIDLPARSANRLWLYPADGTALVGKYVGNVTIGAAEKPEGETIGLTLYGTTFTRQALGVLVILIGVACAWVSTTYIQNRLNRAQLLLPAAALRERVSALQRRLDELPSTIDPAHLGNTRDMLRRLANDLSETELVRRNFLPPSFPNPFRAMAPNAEQYKQYIAERAARVEMIDTILEEGFARLAKLASGVPESARAPIVKATRDLDELAVHPPLPAKDLADKIRPILAEAARAETQVAGAEAPWTAPAQSFEQITAEIRTLSGISWLVYGFLATALGTYILIVLNLGFGVLSDYFVCLFWGFGLPAGGTQLVQSTVGSASTALGFSIPKGAKEAGAG